MNTPKHSIILEIDPGRLEKEGKFVEIQKVFGTSAWEIKVECTLDTELMDTLEAIRSQIVPLLTSRFGEPQGVIMWETFCEEIFNELNLRLLREIITPPSRGARPAAEMPWDELPI